MIWVERRPQLMKSCPEVGDCDGVEQMVPWEARDWKNKTYARCLQAGCVVDISVVEAAEDDFGCHATALAHAIGGLDPRKLAKVEPREIDEATFHGDWFDYDQALLVYRGTVNLPGGTVLENPYFRDIPENNKGGACSIPELWGPGGFAYAFCEPPYPLTMPYHELQRAYSAIVSEIAPRGAVKILNWHQKRILSAAPALRCGAEWWGVFAFTLFVEGASRVFGVVAATTD